MSNQENEKYPGNSFMETQRQTITKIDNEDRRQKREEPRPIAKAKEKKKTIWKRFLEDFFVLTKEDFGERLWTEWFMPGLKNMAEDALHMALYGGRSQMSRRKRDDGSGLRVVSYDKAYDRPNDQSSSPRRTRKPELVFDSREDAEDVLRTLFEYLEDYHRVTVKDLYTLGDMPTDYTMNDWGWYDLSEAVVIRVEDGYLLDMPRVEPIRKR